MFSGVNEGPAWSIPTSCACGRRFTTALPAPAIVKQICKSDESWYLRVFLNLASLLIWEHIDRSFLLSPLFSPFFFFTSFVCVCKWFMYFAVSVGFEIFFRFWMSYISGTSCCIVTMCYEPLPSWELCWLLWILGLSQDSSEGQVNLGYSKSGRRLNLTVRH